MSKKVYDTEQAADYLSVSVYTLRHYVRNGLINHIRLNRKILFKESMLEDFLNSHAVCEVSNAR